jgi:hypothetical protein
MPQVVPSEAEEVKQRELDSSIDRLRAITAEARAISDAFYDKATKLLDFTLTCDIEKSEVQKEQPNGHLTYLNDQINALRYLNRRNTEILDHLNTLL